jgi:selenocysteine lyase/cysteine desulfurase
MIPSCSRRTVAHVPLRLADNHCDFFIAGCHKWLGTHHPLGLGLVGHPRSVDYIRETVFRFVRKRTIDDPLLRFTDQLENDRNSRSGETVNVTPLLSAQGAVDDCDPGCLDTTLRSRLAHADRLLSRIRGSNWRPLIPDAALRRGLSRLTRCRSETKLGRS